MFLAPEDFNTQTDQEKIEAINDGDNTKLPIAIDTAIAEAKLYLSRFDMVDLFGKTGDNRDPILLQWLKDIALWYFLKTGNAGIDYEAAKMDKDDAIKSLVRLQGSDTVPTGWKLAVTATATQGYTMTSASRKRSTYR